MKTEINFENLKSHKDRILIRKYSEMKDSYKEELSSGNPIIYKVYIKDYGDFEEGLTVINPGVIGKEYFMTKGHRHKKVAPEIYILIKGRGKLIIQDKTTKIIDMKKYIFYHIPGTSGHRLVNIGKTPLEVLTIYGKNAGHDYSFKFKKSILKK
ncbi:cupin domain-containing protein [Candidatus Pacearchaeota archaeon]|nr:cupin domain-containing protein [Candidatus Pacearchaeota archaeon]